MNRLMGEIVVIEEFDGLSLIKTKVSDEVIQTIVISDEKDKEFLILGHQVELNFKETEIILSKEDIKNSVENKLNCKVSKINKGTLLCQIEIHFKENILNAIISTQSLENLELKKEDKVWMYIKSNDILISPC